MAGVSEIDVKRRRLGKSVVRNPQSGKRNDEEKIGYRIGDENKPRKGSAAAKAAEEMKWQHQRSKTMSQRRGRRRRRRRRKAAWRNGISMAAAAIEMKIKRPYRRRRWHL